MSFWEDTDEENYCDAYGIVWRSIEIDSLGANGLLLQAWVGDNHPMGGRTYRAVYGPEIDQRDTFEIVHDETVPEFSPRGGCKAIELYVEYGKSTGGGDYGVAEAARLSRMIIDAAVADPELAPYWPLEDVVQELTQVKQFMEERISRYNNRNGWLLDDVFSCSTSVARHAMHAAATMLKGLPRGTYPLIDRGFDEIDDADKYDSFTVTVDMTEYIHGLWGDFTKSQQREED